jgi:hypothetical protein
MLRRGREQERERSGYAGGFQRQVHGRSSREGRAEGKDQGILVSARWVEYCPPRGGWDRTGGVRGRFIFEHMTNRAATYDRPAFESRQIS